MPFQDAARQYYEESEFDHLEKTPFQDKFTVSARNSYNTGHFTIFTLFPKLPAELRAIIWTQAVLVEPRIIRVRLLYGCEIYIWPLEPSCHPLSQVNNEAREEVSRLYTIARVPPVLSRVEFYPYDPFLVPLALVDLGKIDLSKDFICLQHFRMLKDCWLYTPRRDPLFRHLKCLAINNIITAVEGDAMRVLGMHYLAPDIWELPVLKEIRILRILMPQSSTPVIYGNAEAKSPIVSPGTGWSYMTDQFLIEGVLTYFSLALKARWVEKGTQRDIPTVTYWEA